MTVFSCFQHISNNLALGPAMSRAGGKQRAQRRKARDHQSLADTGKTHYTTCGTWKLQNFTRVITVRFGNYRAARDNRQQTEHKQAQKHVRDQTAKRYSRADQEKDQK